MRKWLVAAGLVIAAANVAAIELAIPNRADSCKFAVIGDFGNGDPPEFDIGAQMAAARAQFPFDAVITTGDNMLGRQDDAGDFAAKFERPFGALLQAGVRFHAALGNHDKLTNRNYAPYNMDGQRYYTWAQGPVRFFALDTNLFDPPQLAWIEQMLRGSQDPWKICYFHHPLYSDGGQHGSQIDLRVMLEPIFVQYGVDVVFSGHDHIYERLKPQKGVYYFVAGAGGQLRKGDTRQSETRAASFDQDRTFMLVEVSGDDMYFQTVSRTGATVDAGVIHRRPKT